MSESRKIVFKSTIGTLTVEQWLDDDGYTHIAGDCAECHQFPCKHSKQLRDSDEKYKEILP